MQKYFQNRNLNTLALVMINLKVLFNDYRNSLKLYTPAS